jgi:hypothetical protein
MLISGGHLEKGQESEQMLVIVISRTSQENRRALTLIKLKIPAF